MEVFAFDCYRAYIKDRVSSDREINHRFNFSTLAEKIRVQRSYVSHVVNGRADLNADQLYRIAKALSLSADEADYLLLLLEIDKTQIPDRKKELEKKRDALKRKNLVTEKHINPTTKRLNDAIVPEYYCDPNCPLIHIFLMVDEFRRDPKLLVNRLHLSDEQLFASLAKLEKMGIIKKITNGKYQYEVIQSLIHLEENSLYRTAHATNLRLRALHNLQYQKSEDGNYFHSSTFSATKETFFHIKKKLLKLIEEVNPEIERADSKDVFQMNFDLFKF